MSKLARSIGLTLYRSRWLLVPIYAGLAVLLIFMTVVFISDLVELVLISSLIVTVVISGYENFVSGPGK